MKDAIQSAIEYGSKRHDNEHWDNTGKKVAEYQAEEVLRIVEQREEQRLGKLRTVLGLTSPTGLHEILCEIVRLKNEAKS